MEKEYIYEAKITDAETDEVIAKISAFSQESFEEEMGHTKWSEAVKRYEDKLVKEKEQDLEDAKEAANDELEWSARQEHKLEELDADALENL